jgi:exopolysaccharide biosynthesis protein
MWGANFPAKFTLGRVITDSGSVSPTITDLSPRFRECAIEVIGSYKSSHVNVTVNKVQENGVTYFVSDIYITDLKYFTAPFSDGVYSKSGTTGKRYFVYKIARNNNAIIAVNGDFYSYNKGPVLRSGVLYRNQVYRDMLVMYKNGKMETYEKGKYDNDAIDKLSGAAWHIWTFGPELLSDGQPKTSFNSSVTATNPRTAVGYYEPGHYVFVTVDGRQSGYSRGLKMKDLSQLMYDLGCKVAFNLDGGGTAQMAFMGEEINQPCSTYRKARDAVCIVDGPASAPKDNNRQ